MSGIMPFKTLTLHSLIYFAGIDDVDGRHQTISLPGMSA